jgi:hypothetical protein
MRPRQSRPSGRGLRPWRPQRPTRTDSPSPLGRNSASLHGHNTVLTTLHLARGLDAPSGETPPRSRAGRPLGRDSASLEGWTPPRVSLRLPRGMDAPSSETPPRSRLSRACRSHTHSPTGTFNALTHAGAQVKDESAPCRPFDTAWVSYPDAVPSTLPVRPSPPPYDTVR